MPHPSQCRASPGRRRRKEPQLGCASLPGQPSIHSGCVGRGITGPQHKKRWGGTVRHAVVEAWDPDHSARSSWARLPSILPSGTQHCPFRPGLSRTPAPTHQSPHQRQHCKKKRGGPSPGELPASPKVRGHSPLEQLDARPCQLNYIVAPSLPDTHGHTMERCLLRLLQSLKGGTQGDSGPKHTQPANLRATGPLGLNGPELLRHKANLSPRVGVERGQAPRGPRAGKAR